ncbi:DNA polymerase IV [Reinekea marinisedimentorum]|uniref:DNA polymerase IV n=1 Tax=Reinekea marinisedimentorum TaxID=230495 RepID=A0A4R3I8K8_9GAMM|nr:DNA polymerase IV [Reinekea marinisedimentorum]TCS41671.1 DNA polymerase-4 [Reinekea marinisedimentorum]
MQRKIIHIDCDCYYAALEERDFPHLRGKPVAVGGQGPRSVLATCNYEARKFGVRSAMPGRMAKNRCPSLIVQPARFEVYRSVSEQIRSIFSRYTELVEPLSLDEAYLDVTDSTWFGGSATLLAEHIRAEIFSEVGITVSAGVAGNKYLAKIASDWNKPNGLFIVSPAKVDDFLVTLPVRKISGIGQKFSEKLASMNINTCGDLQQWSLPRLVEFFGKSGPWLYQRARGVDDRPVGGSGERKSLSIEHTFSQDRVNAQQCEQEILRLYEKLRERLNKKGSAPLKGIFLKVRYSSFKTQTIERNWGLTLESFQRLFQVRAENVEEGIRLLGIGVRFDNSVPEAQLSLWPQEDSNRI